MRINKYRVELVKEQGINYETATTPQAAADILERIFSASKRCEEHTWELCMDTKGRVVGVFELATGAMCGCIMDTASVARNALLTNAYGVIIAHNHPSGDPTPSREDIQTTGRIKAGLELLGIALHDHIIIGDSTLSMREHEYI